MHKKIEQFYLSILDYAGLKFENNIIVNANEKLGEFTVDDKYITLPYMENLKNPNGKMIFHLLNENYVNPENALFNLYRKRLIAEINFKLLNLFSAIIEIASDVNIQRKIKNNEILQFLSNFPEIDLSSLEHLVNFCKKSKDVNDEAFLLNIYLKKNGSYKDNFYDAIGKVNFVAYKELIKNLENKEFKPFNYKLRKKDIVLYINLFNSIFPNIDDEDFYTETTTNKTFRYLDVLLKTSYIVSKYINDIGEKIATIDEFKDKKDEVTLNLEWSNLLEDIYELKDEIRLIPNQTDVVAEAHRIKSDTSKSVFQNDSEKPKVIENKQEMIGVVQNTHKQVTPEDILRGSYKPQMMQPVMQPVAQQPFPQTTYMPTWLMREMMQNNQQPNMNPNTYPQMPMQQAMYLQMPMQQAMYPQIPMQQVMYPQMPMQQAMYPQIPMQQAMYPQMPMQQMLAQQNNSTLEVNPLMFQR